MFYPTERTAIFVDGANLYATTRVLGFHIDYKKMLEYFASQGILKRAFYYTAVVSQEEYDPLRQMLDWMDYNGFTMVTKKAKVFRDASGREKTKGNMDIELCIDMLGMCPHVDHMILFSGDGDFRKLVEVVQRQGIRVTVISTIRSQPPMIADELRRQADTFLDLYDLREELGRTLGGRNGNNNVAEEGVEENHA